MSREIKDSGVEWIGEIPEGWEVIPNKHLMKKNKELCAVYNGEDILSLSMKGVYVRDPNDESGKRPTTYDGYQYVKAGDLLMCLFDIDVTPRCVGRVYDNGLTSPAYSRFVMNKSRATVDYYYYYYLALDFDKTLLHLSKNMRSSLTEADFGSIKAPAPSLTEQSQIVSFLDRKCSAIDTAIEKTKKSIEKLEEYKKAVITKAVTKGIDPNAKMKDSGVEWIGEIPEGWEVSKFKFHTKQKSDRNPGNATVLSLYREHGIVIKDSRDDNHNRTSLDTSTYRYVEVGDFVVNKMKAWQGSVAVSDYTGVVSPAYYVYRITDKKIYPLYFHHLLRSCYKDEFMRLSGGIRIGQWDLPADALENTLILIPPYENQVEIANFLERKCTVIDTAIEKKKKATEKWEEYKKSLIYYAVTGKIDCRNEVVK